MIPAYPNVCEITMADMPTKSLVLIHNPRADEIIKMILEFLHKEFLGYPFITNQRRVDIKYVSSWARSEYAHFIFGEMPTLEEIGLVIDKVHQLNHLVATICDPIKLMTALGEA